MWGLVCSAIGCAGCTQVFDIQPTRLLDAHVVPDGVGCSDASFSSVTELTVFTGAPEEADPTLRADGLELWFALRVTPGEFFIKRATRATIADAFGAIEDAPFGVAGLYERDPSLTLDGLRLLFISDRAGAFTLYETTRPALDEPFGPPNPLGGLPNVNGFDISLDGLRLYYVTQGTELWTVARPDTSSPFANPVMLMDGLRFPTISPDELELFYVPSSQSSGIVRRVRARTFDDNGLPVPFDSAEEPIRAGTNPDIAPTAATMVYTSASSVFAADRVCP
jgi:hypothetical protein